MCAGAQIYSKQMKANSVCHKCLWETASSLAISSQVDLSQTITMLLALGVARLSWVLLSLTKWMASELNINWLIKGGITFLGRWLGPYQIALSLFLSLSLFSMHTLLTWPSLNNLTKESTRAFGIECVCVCFWETREKETERKGETERVPCHPLPCPQYTVFLSPGGREPCLGSEAGSRSV